VRFRAWITLKTPRLTPSALSEQHHRERHKGFSTRAKLSTDVAVVGSDARARRCHYGHRDGRCGGLLVSPSTTLGAVDDSLTADPLLFGVVVAASTSCGRCCSWPTTPLAAVVGYGFGAAVGLPIALLGVVVTVLPVFVAARWLSADNAAASETTPHSRSRS